MKLAKPYNQYQSYKAGDYIKFDGDNYYIALEDAAAQQSPRTNSLKWQQVFNSGALSPSGVTAGTYGDATNVAQFTVDVNGIITSAVDVPIAAGAGTVTSVSGTANRVTSTGGATPVIDISATFEALLEKVANKDATGGYAGLTLFKINFKNVLNTFTSFFTNSNTAARTYTFQDRNGTIADDTDLALKAPLASPTFTGTITTPAIIVSSETASRVAIIDGSKNVKSADTATYPSLTELAYVKGVTSAIQTQLGTKKAIATGNNYKFETTDGSGNLQETTVTASRAVATDANGLPTAATTTAAELNFVSGASSNIQTQINAIIATSIEDVTMKAYQALGSAIKAQTVGQSIARITSIGVLTNQLISFVAVYLNTSQTLTGVKWWQGTLGNYTANNENRIGLYSYSGGTLTLVASSTNDGTLWSTAGSATLGSKAFSGTYAAAAGLYFVAFLYCRSAVVTAPALGLCANIQNANIQALDFTNSAKIWAYKTGVTALPATQAMSGLTADAGNFWIAVY